MNLAPQSAPGSQASDQDGPNSAISGVDEKARILIAGGCHVTGYPFGERDSFSSKLGEMFRSSGSSVGIRTQGLINLRSSANVIACAEDFRPDILILQLANYETTPGVRAFIMRRFGAKYRAGSSSSATDVSPLDSAFSRTKWRVKAYSKSLADTLTRHSLIDTPCVSALVESFLSSVSSMGLSSVLVMSPLPCMDPVINSYRRDLCPLFRDLSARFGFSYIDIFDVLDNGATPRRHFYHDGIHLTRAGHDAVAQAIFAELRAQSLQMRSPGRSCPLQRRQSKC